MKTARVSLLVLAALLVAAGDAQPADECELLMARRANFGLELPRALGRCQLVPSSVAPSPPAISVWDEL